MALPADTMAARRTAVWAWAGSHGGRRPALVDYSLAVFALALVVLAVARHGHAGAAVTYSVGVALPVGLGLFRLAHGRDQRFARLLLATAALWALASLSQSNDDALYSIGRVAVWIAEPVLVYLVLAFPLGRLTTSAERRLAAATALLAALLYLPTALLAPFPEPSPFAACGTDCPANALAVVDGGAAVVDVMQPVRELLTVALFGAVAGLMVRRARKSPPRLGSALAPVAAIAVFRALVMAVYLGTRAGGGSSQIADVLGWGFLLSLPAVTLAFAAGLFNQRLFAGDALEALIGRMTPHGGAAGLRESMARALRDPSLRIVYWAEGTPGRWVDESGWPVAAPEAEDGQAVTEVASEGRRVAAIVHDAELARDPPLIQAATSYALIALENERLGRELHASINDVRDSRARIVTTADGERRKIERDLHDGAQQRLVALRIKLGLLAERLDSVEEGGRVHDLEDEVDATIDEVRSFARGIYPPLLAERGLGEALRAAARGAPLPTTLDIPKLRRYPLEVESTVYFACLEALQNAAKHARGATNLWITVSQGSGLRFQVRDNGVGFFSADVQEGSGMTNLRDRIDAIGGTLVVASEPGHGTTVTGMIPTE